MGRAEEGQRGAGPRDRQAVLCGPSKEAVAARGSSGRFWGSDPHAAGAAQGSGQGRSELCFRGNCSLRVEQKAERSVAAGRPERGAPQPAGGDGRHTEAQSRWGAAAEPEGTVSTDAKARMVPRLLPGPREGGSAMRRCGEHVLEAQV